MELRKAWNGSLPIAWVGTLEDDREQEAAILDRLLAWADDNRFEVTLHEADRPLGIDDTALPDPVTREFARNVIERGAGIRRDSTFLPD